MPFFVGTPLMFGSAAGVASGIALALMGSFGGGTLAPSCPEFPVGITHAVTLGAVGTSEGTSGGTSGALAARAPTRTLVLMGGSTEVDAASRQFVEAAGFGTHSEVGGPSAAAGDVLVLRASGSVTSYNGYFQRMGDPPPRSVGSILIEDPAQSAHPALLCRVAEAEALWLAGGNQWNYLGRWAPELQAAIQAVGARGALGGTSAGAAVLGAFAFDAGAGGVTSEVALADPHAPAVRVVRSAIGQPELAATLVDQHFRERNREGRLLVFLARMQAETGGAPVYGIGLDERAALVLTNGRFEVSAHEGRGVSFYRLTEPAPTQPGEPLSLTAVERIVLEDGAQGAWPLDFDAYPRTVLGVDAGTVVLRSSLPERPFP